MNRKKQISDWFLFFAPRFYAVMMAVGVLLRLVLLFMPATETASFSFPTLLRVFGLGLFNDLCFATIALVPALLCYTTLNSVKYHRVFSKVWAALLMLLTGYVVIFNDITDEYGGVMPTLAKVLLGLLTLCFLLKLCLPKIREPWRRIFLHVVMMSYWIGVVLNAFCEVVFWEEFTVRYNFIAVDYLVYTNEVIGNIIESYPMVPLTLAVLAVAAGLHWLVIRRRSLDQAAIGRPAAFIVSWIVIGALSVASYFWLTYSHRHIVDNNNTYASEIQRNGCWSFVEAFRSSELSYDQFYAQIADEEMNQTLAAMCPPTVSLSVDSATTKNIVVITMESMSGAFLEAYGNEDHITPTLDTLLHRGLAFDSLYATGNRTVRGLEAITLCMPPCSGESVVKRENNGRYHSVANELRQHGYTTQYIYGGDSYFDNMKAFFSANGYDIIDKPQFGAQETFSNIWGCCDEDTYRVALETFRRNAESGKPFFAHIMTVSNHRPYTYPEGKIEWDGNPMCRAAAVKYADFALGEFLKAAAKESWFSNTVFVVVADHCASSAGKTTLPVDGYHIPAIIYAPGFIEPQRIDKVCSQIDLMPTVLSLLHLAPDNAFVGRDILSESFRERAFMATYQDLGYYANGVLTVLSPVKQTKSYQVVLSDPYHHEERLMEQPVAASLREAQAYYQQVHRLIEQK